jgi:transcriptional regulator with XRE-family HTH domain
MPVKANQAAPAVRAEERRQVLTAAVTRAGEILGLKQADLGEVLGLSAPTVSRMARGEYLLDPARKEWQLATLFVRMFRSLDSIVGGREAPARAWLTSRNDGLDGVPAELISDVQGLVNVVQYLDAARGRI